MRPISSKAETLVGSLLRWLSQRIALLSAAAGLWASTGLGLEAAPAQKPQFGGFISNGYIDSSHYNYLVDSEEGSFEFFEIGVNASWTPVDRLVVYGQLFAFELGPYGNFEPLVDYLFLDYNVRKEFGVRLGRIKRELGVYNHVQDIDVARTSVLLPGGLYDPRLRDISAALDGVSVYGTAQITGEAFLDYSVYAGYANLNREGGVAGIAFSDASFAPGSTIDELETDHLLGGQLWLSPGVEGLRLGYGESSLYGLDLAASGQLSNRFPDPRLAGIPFQLMVEELDMRFSHLSAEYFVGQWNFVGEYVRTDLNYIRSFYIGGQQVQHEQVVTDGDAWYLSAARRFGKLEAAVIYSEYYADRNNRKGVGLAAPSDGYNKDLQFSLRYDVTDFWTVKAEIHSIKGTSSLFNEFQQNPSRDEEAWSLFAAKSTFTF